MLLLLLLRSFAHSSTHPLTHCITPTKPPNIDDTRRTVYYPDGCHELYEECMMVKPSFIILGRLAPVIWSL